MKAHFFIPILFLTLLSQGGFAQHCAADIYARQYPGLEAQRDAIETATQAWIAAHPDALQNRQTISIPVVVHVVYRTAAQNISQEQIVSQLDVLNADYRALNDNQNIVPSLFQNLIADLEIEFCLASRDPEGKATTGITRTTTTKDDIGLEADVHYSALGGTDAWDPEHYLNIWVADMGENVLGRASFPGGVPAGEDGVVIDPRYFGTTGLASANAPYNLGRTTVHEIGHYFNLHHPWGMGSPSCDSDDLVLDTPLSAENYLDQCPSTLQASCGTLDMYTNFMYYTDDACMAQFTPGQKARVLACLSGPRAALPESEGCQPTAVTPDPNRPILFLLYPNPSFGEVVFECRTPVQDPCRVRILDGMGRPVAELEIPGNQPYPWTAPPGLPAGIYAVQVTAGTQSLVRKWVLAR
jgi:hypothetical protein